MQLFAVAAPGLEPIVAQELEQLGLAGTVEPGGVTFEGDALALARANLWLRSASRVLLRLAELRAGSFAELLRHARRVPWGDVARRGEKVLFRVTTHKARLWHSDAVAERLSGAAEGAGLMLADDPAGAAQQFVVRVVGARCVVSA